MANKTVVIGWDAADWQIIDPLLKKGAMPALKRLIDHGVRGNIATLDPPLSPILWTSIATGKRAYDHGILGFTEVDDENNIRAVRGSSRKTKAFWNILNEHNLKTNIVAWWPSHPAEELNGCMVSNFYQTSPNPKKKNWPLKENSVYPPDLFEVLAELRLHPEEITGEILAPFFPDAEELLSDDDDLLRSVIKILSQTSSVHNAATYLLEETDWDVTAIYYDAIDHFSHVAMKYHPPQLSGISDKDYKNYHFVVEASYRFHDMMLDRIMDLCGDVNFIIVSDHGFINDDNRFVELPQSPAAPALEHRPYGVFVASGPDFTTNESVYGSSLLDICPTLLHLYNIPVARDMEGQVLESIFAKKKHVQFIESHKTESKDIDKKFDSYDEETLEHLANIGYLDNNHIKKKETSRVLDENQFYLARSYANGGYLKTAVAVMKPLITNNPEILRYQTFQLGLLLQINDFQAFEQQLEQTKNSNETNDVVSFYLGQYHLAKANYSLALNAFNSIDSNNTDLLYLIGRTHFIQGNWNAAMEQFQSTLQNDPNHQEAQVALGMTLYELDHFEDSLELLLESLDQVYFDLNTHLYIAKNLIQFKEFEQALSALHVCLQIQPKNKEVNVLIAKAYDEMNTEMPRPALQEDENTIVLVSGLPRSGTSLVMQLLEAGGVQCYTDNNRIKDEHNPKGYYEFKELTDPSSYSTLFSGYTKLAFKITFPLITQLPPHCQYKVIVIERDLLEVIQSQNKMAGSNTENVYFEKIHEMDRLQSHSADWLKKQAHIDLLTISFQDALTQPDSVINKIENFLGKPLDKEQMMHVIDSNLYRSKGI